MDVFQKSNIMATLSDLDKFEVSGELRPRVTIYNKDLFEAIQNEKALIPYTKIKQLLEVAGIDRKVAVFDEAAGVNNYLPLYEVGSSKLARKTHVDLMNKVQVDLYAAGLHRQGSKAVQRYTMFDLFK